MKVISRSGERGLAFDGPAFRGFNASTFSKVPTETVKGRGLVNVGMNGVAIC